MVKKALRSVRLGVKLSASVDKRFFLCRSGPLSAERIIIYITNVVQQRKGHFTWFTIELLMLADSPGPEDSGVGEGPRAAAYLLATLALCGPFG
jgi:hypothetical protein